MLMTMIIIYSKKIGINDDDLDYGVNADDPTLQGKFHLCIPFLGIALPQSTTYFPAAE